MKRIELTQGEYALVDDADYDWLNQWKWYFQKTTGYATRKPYIKGSGRKNQKSEVILMHRLINGTPKGFETDHINRVRLDNRRENLRTVTHSQNMLNITVRSDNESGETGVFWRKDRRKWSVYINKDGKRTYLGNYKDLTEATKVRKGALNVYCN